MIGAETPRLVTVDQPDDAFKPPERWRLAIGLLAIAVVAALGFQTFQLVRERNALQGVWANQEPTIQQATKVRTQLDAISTRVLELAQQGNPGATTIVEELAKRGITINPSASTKPTR